MRRSRSPCGGASLRTRRLPSKTMSPALEITRLTPRRICFGGEDSDATFWVSRRSLSRGPHSSVCWTASRTVFLATSAVSSPMLRCRLSLGLIHRRDGSLFSPRQRRSSRIRRETASSTAHGLACHGRAAKNEEASCRSFARRSVRRPTELHETGDEAFTKS